jgi:uncharacterized protein YdaT
MPWSKTDYPNSLKNFPQAVRNKAIEIANALFKKGTMEEGRIIAIAITNAKKWANNRGLATKKFSKKLKTKKI